MNSRKPRSRWPKDNVEPMRAHVVIVGSINLDISVATDRIPRPGETVLAHSVQRSGGGKGANQAVAAARAGGVHTSMIGCVGNDERGSQLLAGLRGSGVDTAQVLIVPKPSGLALITVDASGENAIAVVAGANMSVAAPNPDQSAVIASAAVVMAQLEIPIAAVSAVARTRAPGALFVLNAAPARKLPDDLCREIDMLVVNEQEAIDIAGTDNLHDAVQLLLARVPKVLVTLGSRGSLLACRDRDVMHVDAPHVVAMDTTAAGDTFCGVLAAALACGATDLQAVQRASAAASLAVERVGAQDSVPTVAETESRRASTYGRKEVL
jgi:ribokinase